MAELIFWTTLAILLYSYLGYPVLLGISGLLHRKPVRKATNQLPRVSIVIAAHNEADRLGRRIQNCLELDYPSDQLELVVISDGSTDETEGVLARYEVPNLRWAASDRRLGKAAALNAGVTMATGDVLVFTDVRQHIDSGALRELLANLSDPEVGAVSGELLLDNSPTTSPAFQATATAQCSGSPHATDLYWRYEKWVRKAESRLDSVIGVTGAIYAVRRALFEPLPIGTILDDVMIPMRIALRGYRVVFEDQALARDTPTMDLRQEFRRKVRTLAGNYQLLRLLPELWSPRRNRLWWQYFSHKVSRLVAPFALIGLLLSSAVLAVNSPWYAAVWAAQMIAYTLAGLGWLLGTRAHSRLTTVPLTFVMLNSAALLGFMEFVRLREDRPQHRLWLKS
jgi:biofilm PGA synthesis N-glycosyltransferase PgaC